MSSYTGACLTILLRFYDFEGAMQWLSRTQPLLGGRIPQQLIEAGQGDEVLQALRSLDQGTFL
jgi:uncharacterized protein (DUF2384 family)